MQRVDPHRGRSMQEAGDVDPVRRLKILDRTVNPSEKYMTIRTETGDDASSSRCRRISSVD